MSGFCDFCGVWHSGGCCHPGRRILAEKDSEIAALKEDLSLWRAFWDGMRYVDRHTYENISPHVRALKERELI